jgi:hypothetical protein
MGEMCEERMTFAVSLNDFQCGSNSQKLSTVSALVWLDLKNSCAVSSSDVRRSNYY